MKPTQKTLLMLSLMTVVLSLVIGCSDDPEPEREKPSYITKWLEPKQPADFTYYVRMKFPDQELLYSVDDPNISLVLSTSEGQGAFGTAIQFSDETTGKGLEVQFYKLEDDTTDFVFAPAEYLIGIPGGNMLYLLPKTNTLAVFNSTPGEGFSFNLHWVDDSYLSGSFKTTLKSCCSNETFDVEGDFLIPRIAFAN